jgi:hypothetical protein
MSSDHHAPKPKKYTPVEEIGLHVVLLGSGLLVTLACIAIAIAIFAYGLFPSLSYRLAAVLLLIMAIVYTIQSIKATYVEFFETRRSR